MEESYDTLGKILLVGPSGVGKTNILHQLVENKFYSDYKPSIGFDNLSKTSQHGDKIVLTSKFGIQLVKNDFNQ